MKLLIRIVPVAVLVATVAGPLLSQQPPAKSRSNAQLLARGKYLVEEAGQCQDCHTPRNQKGEFIRQNWLMGSPLFVKPVAPIPDWVEVAPPIAGLPALTEKQAVTALMTGKLPDGSTLRPPMPAFRFNRADATAIATYLKSLNRETAKGIAER